jgi:hypothetical protein
VGSNQHLDRLKEKATTKMADIFVLIVGVSELPKFIKIQLIIGSSKKI